MAEGNTTVGDGPKYKGHGIIKGTWKSAHQKYQNFSGAPVVNSPMLLCEDIYHAVNSAFWIWCNVKKLNEKIPAWEAELTANPNAGGDKIVTRVTKSINAGDNGLAGRKEIYRKLREHFK